jgi:hypothetical protein
MKHNRKRQFSKFLKFEEALLKYLFRNIMAKNGRKDARQGKHGMGSWKKKSGPKAKRHGKTMSAAKLRSQNGLEEARWKRKIPKLIASLALVPGQSMDSGAARMALYTTLKVIEEAQDLRFDVAGEKA